MYKTKIKISKKILNRVKLVFTLVSSNIIASIFNLLLSLLIIHLSSMQIWGEFVPYLIIFQLASFFIAWGHSLYIQRELSKNVFQTEKIWFDCLISRVPLFFVAAIIVSLLDLSFYYKVGIIIWLLFNYGYKSFDSIIVFKREFKFSFLLNLLVSVSFLLTVLFYKNLISPGFILILFIIYEFVKLITCTIYFYNDFKSIPNLKVKSSILIACLPFFLQGFVGLLQSRIDTYYIALISNKDQLAQYHIIISFLLLIKSIIDMFLRPFLKNIYRMNIRSLKRMSLEFLSAGVFLSIFIVAFLYFILVAFYELKIDLYMLLLSYLYIIPMYYYVTMIYVYYRYNKENLMLLYSVIIILLSILLNIFLVNKFGIAGALITAVIREWVVLIIYAYSSPKISMSYAKA